MTELPPSDPDARPADAAHVPSPAPASPAPPADAAAVVVRDVRMFWWLSLIVIAADQGTKALVRATMALFDHVTIIPGVLEIVHVRNAGVAFGFLDDVDLPHKGAVTAALAIVALVGIWYYARHLRHEERLARTGLSLILGGAVGNLADRLRAGFVVDFVDVSIRGWHFWAFNLADAAITIGAILVFLDLLLVTRHAPHSV